MDAALHFPWRVSADPVGTCAVIEQSGLWLTDLETWRLHYAKTLAAWNERFPAHRAQAAGL